MSSVRAKKQKSVVEPEQPLPNVVVEFPQSEQTSPVEASPDERYGDKPGQDDGYGYRVHEPDALAVEYDSMKLADLERGAILRIFRDRFRNLCKYYMSKQGGEHSAEGAASLAKQKYGNKTAAEVLEELMGWSVESVSFSQLYELWDCSPEESERYFAMVKNEGQREFATGHLAAKVFEPVDWMSTVWQRAQFLAVRDTFLAEYVPDGGIEYALVDMMVQSYFMQQYWLEEAVKTTRTDPRRESFEFAEWKKLEKARAKANQWEPGYWEVPYASQLQCIENASNMAQMFAQMFHRALRQLNNHRVTKLKIMKLKAETRRINALTRKTVRDTQAGGEEGVGRSLSVSRA